MNERIRQLAEQAVVSVDIVTGNEALDDELAKMYIQDCFSEKFAELIVNECCATIANTDRYRSEYFIAIIKEHFGVEE